MTDDRDFKSAPDDATAEIAADVVVALARPGYTWKPSLSAFDVVTLITALGHRIAFVRTLPADTQVLEWLANAEDLHQRLAELPGVTP